MTNGQASRHTQWMKLGSEAREPGDTDQEARVGACSNTWHHHSSARPTWIKTQNKILFG